MSTIRPFVEPGEQLGYAAELKARGFWPPRLPPPDAGAGKWEPALTPFLVIPATPADEGGRPLPNSAAFHSQGVWLEDAAGTQVEIPAAGGQYRIRCRVRNNGALAAYGALADFFVNSPEAFTAAAGVGGSLPALGHTGFTLRPGQERILTCPALWQPASATELNYALVVQVFDPFTDNLTRRFDARNDRHVGRHDTTADLYVRDWTASAASHDDGREPSGNPVFYQTSDVWNRRVNSPGTFPNDQPEHQRPQAGDGKAGDNFAYARISRSSALTEQTVAAHFMYAEFGTGSPFVSCSAAPDPTVTLAIGETSQLVALPWHLPPTTSTHLCLAVQVSSATDPYAPPGLVGRTPGWPTTDTMVLADNNKAQRNTSVWQGVSDTPGLHVGLVYNAATTVRDVVLRLDVAPADAQRLRNASLSVPLSRVAQDLRAQSLLTLPAMQPGERRWVALSFDSFTARPGQELNVFVNELVGASIVNGFNLSIRSVALVDCLAEVLSLQTAVFYRMATGLKSPSATKGLLLNQRLAASSGNPALYLRLVPELVGIIGDSFREVSKVLGGVRDVFGLMTTAARLQAATSARWQSIISQQPVATVAAQHQMLLRQLDAQLTMAFKNQGDVADILFTVRLQREVYQADRLRARAFDKLLALSERFIAGYPQDPNPVGSYQGLVRSLLPFFDQTQQQLGSMLAAPLVALKTNLDGPPEGLQKAHLAFLNTLAAVLTR